MRETFGWPLPRRKTYSLYVALWLNLERVWMRPANAMMHAMGGGDVPAREIFDAASATPEIVDDVWWEAIKARNRAKGKQQDG